MPTTLPATCAADAAGGPQTHTPDWGAMHGPSSGTGLPMGQLDRGAAGFPPAHLGGAAALGMLGGGAHPEGFPHHECQEDGQLCLGCGDLNPMCGASSGHCGLLRTPPSAFSTGGSRALGAPFGRRTSASPAWPGSCISHVPPPPAKPTFRPASPPVCLSWRLDQRPVLNSKGLCLRTHLASSLEHSCEHTSHSAGPAAAVTPRCRALGWGSL